MSPWRVHLGEAATRVPTRLSRLERRTRLLLIVLFPLWLIEWSFMWRDRRRRRKANAAPQGQ